LVVLNHFTVPVGIGLSFSSQHMRPRWCGASVQPS
jgi:hypothetical protein